MRTQPRQIKDALAAKSRDLADLQQQLRGMHAWSFCFDSPRLLCRASVLLAANGLRLFHVRTLTLVLPSHAAGVEHRAQAERERFDEELAYIAREKDDAIKVTCVTESASNHSVSPPLLRLL